MSQDAATADESAWVDESVTDGEDDVGYGDGDGGEHENTLGGEAGPVRQDPGKLDADADTEADQDEGASEAQSRHIDFVTLGMFIVGKSAPFFRLSCSGRPPPLPLVCIVLSR